MGKTFKLGKDQRLKSRKLIGQLFERGKSVSSYPLRAVFLPVESSQPLQAGFTVSSKTYKKAVKRNRIKRLMREAYRLQRHDLEDQLVADNRQLVIFFIYTGKEIAGQEEVAARMRALLGMVANRPEVSGKG